MAATAETKSAPMHDNLILNPESLFELMTQWAADGCHVLTPATRVQRFAPNWGASYSVVSLNPTVDYENGRGIDTYFDPGTMKRPGTNVELHERGISKVGLDRIARCAGISWDPVFSGRVDQRQLMHLWEFRAVGVMMNFDGQPETLSSTKEVDLRDGSAQIGGWTLELWRQENEDAAKNKRAAKPINGWSDRRVLAARSHGLQMAESKAKERAIRSLGLQHIYTVAQLRKPFIVVKASYLPDMHDPEIRSMVAEQALRGTRALFAPQQRATIHAIDITPVRAALPEAVEPERIPVTTEREPVAAQGAAAVAGVGQGTPAATPSHVGPVDTAVGARTGNVEGPTPTDTDEPPTERAVTVVEVKDLKTGTGRNGAWTLVKVSFSDGQSFTTLDAGVAQDARDAEQASAWVEYTTKQDGKYENLVSIEPAGQQPSFPETELL